MKERTIQKEIRDNRLLINITQWEARVGKKMYLLLHRRPIGDNRISVSQVW